MNDSPTLVAIVDDDPSVRTALGRLLRSAGFRVVVYGSAEEFLPEPAREAACVILDVNLPGLDGLSLMAALHEGSTSPPVVFITGHGTIPLSVQAMRAGAVDFLAKPVDAEDLLRAVGEGIARSATARRAETELVDQRSRANTLTPREREVMALVVAGLPNKAIGARLGVCEKTVKAHRGQVMHKMKAESLADLVRMAGRLGIGPPVG